MASINGVECPDCGHTTTPVRHTGMDAGGARIRQRECVKCLERFTTVEIPLKHSFHKLARGGKEKDGPFKQLWPDSVWVAEMSARVLHVKVILGIEKRPLCRRGLHANDYRNRKGNQCRLCLKQARRNRYLKTKGLPPEPFVQKGKPAGLITQRAIDPRTPHHVW